MWLQCSHISESLSRVGHFASEGHSARDEFPSVASLHLHVGWGSLETVYLDAVLDTGDSPHPVCCGERSQPEFAFAFLLTHFCHQAGYLGVGADASHFVPLLVQARQHLLNDGIVFDVAWTPVSF